MNIFNEIIKALKETHDRLEVLAEGTEEYGLERQRLEAFDDLKLYINGITSARVLTAIRSPNYAQAARELGSTEESLRASVHQSSKKIRNNIGFDIVEEIMSGDAVDAQFLLKLRTDRENALRELFPDGVLQEFPADCKISKVKPEEFVSAVTTLRKITNQAFAEIVSTIPQKVLSTIIGILHGDNPEHMGYQATLYRFLCLDIDMEDMAKRLKIKLEEAVENAPTANSNV